MSNNEGLFYKKMNAIIYYSNTNESFKIAEYIHKKTNYELFDITKIKNFTYDNIYLVFPIHYQSIPKEIRPLIKKIVATKTIVLATYGKKSYGNVLLEAKRILNAKIVCGAYIPTKHTYILDDTSFMDYDKLNIIFDRMNSDTEAIIKKGKTNPFRGFFPILRHRISIKIIKTKECNNCNLCNSICPFIHFGKIDNNKCNRCLKCYYSCKNKGLTFKKNKLMDSYLKKKNVNDLIIY